jgi:hypothetical protein
MEDSLGSLFVSFLLTRRRQKLEISRLIFAKYQPPLKSSDPLKRVNPARLIDVAKRLAYSKIYVCM